LDLHLVALALIGYTTLGLARSPARIERDLSYGVYVLAYPTQEVLVSSGIGELGLAVMITVSIAVVLGLAFASWTFVERPALALRKRAFRPKASWLPARWGQARSVPTSVVVEGRL
jgi:peptidoglycan/LPS O-acetylase OafA/YrhL